MNEVKIIIYSHIYIYDFYIFNTPNNILLQTVTVMRLKIIVVIKKSKKLKKL